MTRDTAAESWPLRTAQEGVLLGLQLFALPGWQEDYLNATLCFDKCHPASFNLQGHPEEPAY